MKLFIAIALYIGCALGAALPAPQYADNSYDWPNIPDKIDLDFQQHDINATSGLLFDEMGNVQVYHSEWAFVTYVNLSYFASEIAHLERTVETIQRLCGSIQDELELPIPGSSCVHTIPQLYILLDDIKEYSAKWFMSHESEQQRYESTLRRKKRGFLGSISKRLFFSMSDDEASFYRNQINAFKAENAEQYVLTRNQTTLFQETLKVLNNTMKSQIIQRNALQQQLDELEFLLRNATASSMLSGKLNDMLQYTTFVITSFWEKQQHFYEIVTTKSKSFQLIPPRLFMKELERVSRTIARQGLQLPIPLTRDNLAKFYQITTTDARLMDNNLVIRFMIPLVEAQQFVLYKAMSLPYRNGTNDTFSFVVPHNEYIALDTINDKFITLTYEDLKTCHRFDRKNLVCKQTFPIMTANSSLGCEVNLLRKTNFTSSCDYRTVTLKEELWAKLQMPNTFLYTLPKPQVVAIVCPHSRTKLFLQDTGVISMTSKCKVKTERVEIVAFQTIESKRVQNFTPSAKFNVSISDEVARAKNVTIFRNPNLPDIDDEDGRKITRIHDDLDGIQEQSEINRASIFKAISFDGESSIHPVLLVIIVMVVIALGILVAIVCFKYCAVPGCNILIFVMLVVIATPVVIFLF